VFILSGRRSIFFGVFRLCCTPMPESATTDNAGSVSPAATAVIPRQRRPAPDEPRTATGPRVDALVWAIPALLTGALGCWHLTRPALWADELATLGAARLYWDQLWQLTRNVDGVLAPYYAAMKIYVTVAGASTAALRLPTLLAMVGTAVVVAVLGRRLGGRGGGLVAGLLFGVLPATSRYAQEARSYAIVMFAAALAVLCLIRMLERPGLGRVAGYAAAILLASLAHPLSALLVLLGHGCAVLLSTLGNRTGGILRTAVAWLAAALIGGLPAVVLLASGYGSRAQIAWIDPLTLATFQAIPDRLFGAAAAGGIVLGLAVLAVRRSRAAVCVAGAAFGPLVALVAAGAFAPVYTSRYVLVSVAPLAALAGAAAIRFGRAQAAAVVALTAMLGWPAQIDFRTTAGHYQDSAKIAAIISPRYRPGDVAVFPDTHPSIPWAPRDIYERYLPAPRPPDVLRTSPQRTDGRFLATECPDAACLGDPPRIWVIRVDASADPFKYMSPGKRDRLRDGYRISGHWYYAQLGITLLVRK
jgi:mannosyltransferase